MIYVIIGTRAQLVKMAPVIKLLESRSWPLRLLYTGQHRESMADLCRDFAIVSHWHPLTRESTEIKTVFHAVTWALRLSLSILVNPTALLPQPSSRNQDVVLVHGDTLSTLIGAWLGKRLGIKVAHVEAGLRSFNLLNPFPEELVRRLVSYLADIAFCPGAWASNNLAIYEHLTKIDTQTNTIVDALRWAQTTTLSKPKYQKPDTEYGVVSIHRLENIFFKKTLVSIVNQLVEVAAIYRLVFVLHPATRKRLAAHNLLDRLEKHPNIELRERTGYLEFVQLLSESRFVITDGGSNQEELSILKIPTLLMRKHTERQEGLTDNVVLGGLSAKVLKQFMLKLNQLPDIQVPVVADNVSSPSQVICDALKFAIVH